MKKKDVVQILSVSNPSALPVVLSLKRNGIYILRDLYMPTQTVILTHFYRSGLRFKPLTKRVTRNFPIDIPFTITWNKLNRYTIEEVPKSHLLKCVNQNVTEYFTEAMSNNTHKPTTNNIARELSSLKRKLHRFISKVRPEYE